MRLQAPGSGLQGFSSRRSVYVFASGLRPSMPVPWTWTWTWTSQAQTRTVASCSAASLPAAPWYATTRLGGNRETRSLGARGSRLHFDLDPRGRSQNAARFARKFEPLSRPGSSIRRGTGVLADCIGPHSLPDAAVVAAVSERIRERRDSMRSSSRKLVGSVGVAGPVAVSVAVDVAASAREVRRHEGWALRDASRRALQRGTVAATLISHASGHHVSTVWKALAGRMGRSNLRAKREAFWEPPTSRPDENEAGPSHSQSPCLPVPFLPERPPQPESEAKRTQQPSTNGSRAPRRAQRAHSLKPGARSLEPRRAKRAAA